MNLSPVHQKSSSEHMLELILLTNKRLDEVVKMVEALRGAYNSLATSVLKLHGESSNEKSPTLCPHGFAFYDFHHECQFWQSEREKASQGSP